MACGTFPHAIFTATGGESPNEEASPSLQARSPFPAHHAGRAPPAPSSAKKVPHTASDGGIQRETPQWFRRANTARLLHPNRQQGAPIFLLSQNTHTSTIYCVKEKEYEEHLKTICSIRDHDGRRHYALHEEQKATTSSLLHPHSTRQQSRS